MLTLFLNPRIALPCALAMGLAACGIGVIKPPPSATFTTTIAPGGLKFFVYKWGDLDGGDLSASTLTTRSTQAVPEGELPPVRYVVDHRAGFDAALQDKLEETGYCRDGYYELSSHFVPGEFRLRGECKELASEEDRARFGNSGNP